MVQLPAVQISFRNVVKLRQFRATMLSGGKVVASNMPKKLEITGSGKQDSGMPSVLSITTMGRFAASVDGRDIGPLGRKARALLGYLALSDTGEVTRERLVGLLWSESAEEKARASMRQALHEIREALSGACFTGLVADKLAISLDNTKLDVDLLNVLRDASNGRAHPILMGSARLFEGILQDLETTDPAFRAWLLPTRQALGDRVTRLLEAAMRDDSKSWTERESLARAVVNLDPTHEEATRFLIQIKAAAGDVGGALRLYKGLWDLLEQEYDVEPSIETQELIARIRLSEEETATRMARRQDGSGETGNLPATAPPALIQSNRPPKLIISIAAFDEAGTREANRYLVQGFRRELIACLVRFREWVVCDMAAASSPDPSSTNPEYLIEAMAMEAGGAIRLIITLRDIADNAFLWSERVTISVANWFEVQQHIVRRVSSTLNVHLSVERLEAIARQPPGMLRAYDIWLLGQATFLSFDAKNWERARNLFRQVITEMPHFAPAHSSLAQLCNSLHIVMPGIFRDAARAGEALAYAREAARLDPVDSRSQLCLGWSYAMAKQYEQALIYIPLAYGLNESDPWTLVSAATSLAFCGEADQARDIAAEVLALPMAPSPLQWAYHATIRFMIGDYAGCIQAGGAGGNVNPNVPGYTTAAFFHLGREDEARAEWRRFLEVTRQRWHGEEPASEANVARWFLTSFPIRHAEDWRRLRDGLAGAGAPIEGLKHHQW